MKDKASNPAPVPAPFPWSVGVVAHNEGRAGRLRPWLEHWEPLAAQIILILHNCDDDSAEIAAEFGITPITVSVSGLMESILWETVLYARPESWHLRLGGCDEFISLECLERARRVIGENPDLRLFYVARKNYCDGKDISGLLGLDWQVALMRPHPSPIEFKGGIHSYPRLLLHASQVGLMEPSVCWIDHQRTFADIVRCNKSRDGFGSVEMVQAQDGFIERVRQIVGEGATQ